jgi:epoxyqueuosine reductase
MMTIADFTVAIKSMALNLGFDKVGVTSAQQPQKSAYLNAWLDNNFHGTMNWLDRHREKRLDISKLFPGAKSIVCLAHNYYTAFEHSEKRGTGKISRYAWGQDYHRIMKKKLKQLLKEIINLNPKIAGRLCVDTAPMMEKLWAEQAGLGWQGKHTNLISRDYGSWIFLGELILNQELLYDKPISDFCGSCQACIDACPTKAITEPYVLNATKCISYLTIEFWDKPIPESFKKHLNGWIFGCDICQDVCPWNKFSRKSAEPRYYPDKENLHPDLRKWLDMDEETFKKKFKKSPLARPGFKNFIRNIKINR